MNYTDLLEQKAVSIFETLNNIVEGTEPLEETMVSVNKQLDSSVKMLDLALYNASKSSDFKTSDNEDSHMQIIMEAYENVIEFVDLLNKLQSNNSEKMVELLSIVISRMSSFENCGQELLDVAEQALTDLQQATSYTFS